MKTDSGDPRGRWEALDAKAYALEAELQDLLDTGSAELIPGDPSLEETHVAFAREVATSSGPIDLIGIGSSGSVTIMECKLAANRQVKREVVGQVLDYAAALWGTDATSFADSFSARAGTDPFSALRAMFGPDEDAFDETVCRSEVERRLRDGDFRLLVAVDRMDPELARIIQYVNSRGSAGHGLRLVAVAFPRFEKGVVQVLVPETFGDEQVIAPVPSELSDTQRLHLDYWTEFRDHLYAIGSPIRFNRPNSLSIASTGVTPHGNVFRAWNRMIDGFSGVEVQPKSPDALVEYAAILEGDTERVDRRLQPFGEVRWKPLADKPVVWVVRNGKAEGEPTDRAAWPRLMDWMAKALAELWDLFEPAPAK